MTEEDSTTVTKHFLFKLNRNFKKFPLPSPNNKTDFGDVRLSLN